MPAKLLSCKTNLTMLLSCLSTLFGSFFSCLESRSNYLAWLSLSEISLTSVSLLFSILPSHKPYVLSYSVHCCPNNCQTLCGFHVFTHTITHCLVNSIYTQVSLLKCSFFHLMHSYSYVPSLFPLYFAHISGKGTYNTISIYITTANVLCVHTMCQYFAKCILCLVFFNLTTVLILLWDNIKNSVL